MKKPGRTGRSEAEAGPRPRVVHGVAATRYLRAVSPIAFVCGVIEVVLHLLGPLRQPDVVAIVLAGWVVLTSAAAGWIAWRCPAMTCVDGDGVVVRGRSLRAERYTWAQIVWVHPAGARTRSTTLHPLDGGRPIVLPGVDQDAGTWLASLVDDAHTAGDTTTLTTPPPT